MKNIQNSILIFLISAGLNLQAQPASDRIIFHYLKLSSALSKSDFKKAGHQAQQLSQACEKSGIAGLAETSKSMANAGDLSRLRDLFSPFSDSLALSIQSGRIQPAEDLFIVHCPMAFNDQGADWVSDEAKVINPYFGDEMLHCGKVKATLKAKSK